MTHLVLGCPVAQLTPCLQDFAFTTLGRQQLITRFSCQSNFIMKNNIFLFKNLVLSLIQFFPPLHATAQGPLVSRGDVVHWAESSFLSLVRPLLAALYYGRRTAQHGQLPQR